jgi:hypothetical protein
VVGAGAAEDFCRCLHPYSVAVVETGTAVVSVYAGAAVGAKCVGGGNELEPSRLRGSPPGREEVAAAVLGVQRPVSVQFNVAHDNEGRLCQLSRPLHLLRQDVELCSLQLQASFLAITPLAINAT